MLGDISSVDEIYIVCGLSLYEDNVDIPICENQLMD